MAESTKNELPLENADKVYGVTVNGPIASVGATEEPPLEDPAVTNPVAAIIRAVRRDADADGYNDDVSSGEVADTDGHIDANGDLAGAFSAAPVAPGEFFVPLRALVEWPYHPRFGSRQKSDHFAALALTAINPSDLKAIEVLPAVDGVHPIIDGRFVYHALKSVHQTNESVEIRCILFPGTEAEAVVAVCDTAVGTVETSAMEKAQALHNIQRINAISQRKILERYPRLNEDRLSNMMIAARMREAYPILFDLLTAPDQAPISHGTKILTLKKSLSSDEFQAMLDRAEGLAANGDRYKPNETFEALQVNGGDKTNPLAGRLIKPKPIVPLESEPILGHDDLPVAAYERLADNVDRIRLPDASVMTLTQREAAAEACIVQIRRHFGLSNDG